MSLEQFKMQVLLLHSEQSTLDSLSSGFNDRYTVHCASSGSEALHTLGETQIDVIVTAQRLPGMSGLEALREAKKRSPETIGILLAGESDNDVEALVGDQEVFQIVRDKVTPESLRSLIDNATRQARLLALAQSANDTSADVDAGEHIVMETSENGSAIISDGTGRMPVLNPKKIAAAADLGVRAVDVLVISQDDEFVQTVRESARGLHNIIHANTLQQADKAVADRKIGVAVIDAAMVGSDVESLTLHLRASAPRLVAIVAGRRDDGEMLMDLINRSKVYRFLLKPVSPGRSRLAIEASVKHHLEAPDSAFASSGKPAPMPQEKISPPKSEPVIKPVPVAPPKPAARVEPVSKLKPATKPEPVAKSKPVARPEPVAKPKPVAKPEPAPKPKPVTKPEPVAKPTPAPAPKAAPPPPPKKEPQPATTAPVAKRPEPRPASDPPPRSTPQAQPARPKTSEPRVELPNAIVAKRSEALSPVHENLGDAFGGSDTRFTETVTGIVESVTRSFSRKSAAPQSIPRVAGSGTRGALAGKLRYLGIGAVAAVVLAAATAWMLRSPGEPVPDTPVSAAEPQLPTTSVTEAEPVFEPAPPVATGPDVDGLLAEAEQAMLDHRPDAAAAALQEAESAAPDNPRLPFLRAQLSATMLRAHLDDARVAIRESRFEDARDALAAAGALGTDDAAEIDTITAELNAALSEQRVDEVLAKASARLDEGRLIAPSNDNARYYYELALSNDPENSAARQGLMTIASKLILRARAEIDQGNLSVADSLVADAYRLDPDSPELEATSAVLQEAQDRREEQRRQAMERAAAERAEAEREAAERAAAERAGTARSAPQTAASTPVTSARVNNQSADEAEAAPRTAPVPSAPPRDEPEVRASGNAEPQLAMAASYDPQDTSPDIDGSSITGTPADGPAQASVPPAQVPVTIAPVAQQTPVLASSLQRTRFVAPKYPRSAQRRGISGWVDVAFTVDIDGTVTDVAVVNAEPVDTFDTAAVNAVEEWQYEPVIDNGIAVQKRAAVRLMFALE